MTNKYPQLNNLKIKIFTRSFSLELYTLAKELFKDMAIPIVRLTDQSADGYFYTILKDTNCDIAINIDEDAFILNPDAILELANFVVENNYANAGSPDAGDGCPRGANPIVTNPFFNILNLKLIRTKFISKKDVQSFDYLKYKREMEAAFPIEMLSGKYNFNAVYTEPYYPFFFWLAYNFKTLYLKTKKHPDNISTILYSPSNKIICYHSWFARFYNTPSFFVKFFQKGFNKQKTRIDNLINEVYAIREMQRPEFTSKDYLKFRKDVLIRWSIKIPQRIANWPNKWKKWYKKSQNTALK